MTTRAIIDTPWETAGDVNRPKLPSDTQFWSDAGDPSTNPILSWKDVTGEEGQDVGPPYGVLYGGNYAKVTGIQPDYAVGRLGGSGDPDWLMIEITFDEVAHPNLLADIDSEDDYAVYWDEVEQEDPAPVAASNSNYRNREDIPAPNTWGQFRSKMARRGVSQAWIDANFDKREIMWGEHDFNGRRGYLTGQYNTGGAVIVDIPPLVTFLADEGWTVLPAGDDHMLVVTTPQLFWISAEQLLSCDYDDFDWPNPLKADLMDYMTNAGYC